VKKIFFIVILLGVVGIGVVARYVLLTKNTVRTGVKTLMVGDSQGRTAVITDPKVTLFKKEGYVPFEFKGQKGVERVVGLFEKWETIEGSQDRTMVLRPINGKGYLPKVRVIFGISDLTQSKTAIRVIDLNKVKTNDYDKSMTVVGYVADLNSQQLGKAIKQGDIVDAECVFAGKTVVDDFGQPVAYWLDIRRWGGAGAFEEEIK